MAHFRKQRNMLKMAFMWRGKRYTCGKMQGEKQGTTEIWEEERALTREGMMKEKKKEKSNGGLSLLSLSGCAVKDRWR